MKKQVTRSRKIRKYTYLGCVLTKNRSPWCFRMCPPDKEGRGRCGRIAPHTLKGHIQQGVIDFDIKKKASDRRRIVKLVKRTRKLPDYTYLGCVMTRNRSPWCFRMCKPDSEGRGNCGRIAPHTLKGTIQNAVIKYDKKKRR